MDIRLAVKEDIPDLIRIRMQFLKEKAPDGHGANGSKEDVLAAALETYYCKHLTEGHPTGGELIMWVAVDAGRIVATGGICFNHYPPDFEVVTEIRARLINLFALPGYKKRGLEERLFQKLLDEAEQRKAGSISLHDSEAGMAGNKNFVLYRK
jgi:GNAT superfamily N-acetyltransferase